MAHGAPEYAETHVNDLMNVVYNNANGEYVYLLQLGSDGEVIGATDEQGLQYVILKNDHDDGVVVESTTTMTIDVNDINQQHFQGHNHNGTEDEVVAVSAGYEEEIFGGVNVEEHEEEEPKQGGMDNEQVSAATHLLEFHNQQAGMTAIPTTDAESEFLETRLDSNDEQKPDTKELLKLLEAAKDAVIVDEKSLVSDQSQAVNIDGEFVANHHLPILPIKEESCVKKTYSRNSSIPIDIKEEPSSGNVESLAIKAGLRKSPTRKRRRAIFDHVKVISNSEFKKQLADTSDITGKLELAPRTKKAMNHLAFSGVGKYFAYPGRRVHGMLLAQLFYTRLQVNVEQPIVSRTLPVEPLAADLLTPGSYDLLHSAHPPLEQIGSLECPETVLRKTVDSFDNMIKRMNTDRRRQEKKKLNRSTGVS